MIKETLIHHGLTSKEANAYMAGLELGPSPASRIARNIKESRVNTYAICQNLIKKQCAVSFKKNNVIHFEMISPRQFLGQINSKMEAFKKIIPDLDLLASRNINKPKVKYFEGLSGLKRMFDVILENTNIIHGFLGADKMSPSFKDYMDNVFIPQRISLGIPINVIASNTPADMFYKNTERESLRQVRIIDQSIFDFAGEILLFDENKVAIGMYEKDEMMGVILESKHFYNSQYSLFRVIWKLTESTTKTK